ncbi:hypothetical protein [Pectobacterium parmentieri]|uniref:Uncharacterized protein n=1 Tax=Pectobacterium parmentieri TaxID=1905730 RepID=A0A8B3F465_PECPM|nr:hypothetical protein [Pectobacterium parmentieri]AOR59370.1 hypothetical protein A8F97_10695 [Pectobacterium parmentieri]AYH09649.1 hypothetical protein C5E24_08105 [Pectobacterium parmentieri]AYH19642.1 hypothetical protein C5E22_14695 [Pectobacterium parmentieri]AYH35961.1 hypothetical protein C5E17_07975 [Pectobacterium parmentieri]AZS56030.1 hypothetical protein C5E18_07810 [Pectobacterium parmentieri]
MIQLSDIERIAPGVANLSPEEHEALQRFTLLWTLFEAQMLGSNASVRTISEKVQNIDPQIIRGGWFAEHLEYFCNRYVDDGNTNQLFENLHLRSNDNPGLVRTVLTGENVDLASQLICCLIIVYRFRNNFFHGVKWAYDLRGQFDNFSHSACLLRAFLERVPNGI